MKTQIFNSQQVPFEVVDVPVLGNSIIGTVAGLAIVTLVTGMSIFTIKLVKESLDGERSSRSVSMAVNSMLIFLAICAMAAHLVFGPGLRDGNLGDVKENTVEVAK